MVRKVIMAAALSVCLSQSPICMALCAEPPEMAKTVQKAQEEEQAKEQETNGENADADNTDDGHEAGEEGIPDNAGHAEEQGPEAQEADRADADENSSEGAVPEAGADDAVEEPAEEYDDSDSMDAASISYDETSGIRTTTTTEEIKLGEVFSGLDTHGKNDIIGDYEIKWETSNKNIVAVTSANAIKGVSLGYATVTGYAYAESGKYLYGKYECMVYGDLEDVSVSDMTVELGKSEKQKITFVPELSKSRDISITSSDPSIVKVAYEHSDMDGHPEKLYLEVTGLRNGTEKVNIKITGEKGSVTKTITVVSGTGKPDPVARLNKKSMVLYKGQTFDFNYRFPYELVWSSSNEKKAVVTQDGKVKAVGNGTVYITCVPKTNPDGASKCRITVKTLTDKITLNKKSTRMFKGSRMTLTPSVLPSSASNKEVSWKSSDASVAAVSAQGVVTAKKKGVAVITCTAKDGSGAKASCRVTVTIPVGKITLSKTKATLLKGRSLTLKAAVSPADAENRNVEWKSDNAKVAAVSATGKVTAKAKGRAVISCRSKDGSGTKAVCVITVE